MIKTGISRRIDDMGRVVIPKELRRTLRIEEGDVMDIFTSDNMICFQKHDYENICINSLNNIIENVRHSIAKN